LELLLLDLELEHFLELLAGLRVAHFHLVDMLAERDPPSSDHCLLLRLYNLIIFQMLRILFLFADIVVSDQIFFEHLRLFLACSLHSVHVSYLFD
jgi:hypothetical protein